MIVVGGGISGMSFAHFATKSKFNVLVLEKDDRIGGSFHSAKMEKGDLWLELGAHTCYNSYGSLIEIIEDCGVINEISERAKVPFKLLKNNQAKSFPSQINFLELLISVPNLFFKKKEGETVESYYGSIVGKRNFKKVFSALFSAVPSQNADEFPANALFKKRNRRKDIIKHFTMKNGLESIARAIESNDNLDISLKTAIEKIEKTEKGYRLKTTNGVFTCTNLSICTSVTSAPDLIRGISPQIAEKIEAIKFQKIESFGVIVAKDASELKPFAGLVPVNDDFFSAVSRDTVPNNNFRGFTFHFKPDLLSSDEKLDKVCSVLGISKEQVLEIHEKMNIVPSLRLGHYDLVYEIDALLAKSTLFLSGNYFAGLSIEDCTSRSKTEVERMKMP